ncbi:MAG: hypothetical protein QOH04_2956 [Sphingomonadales bacterium]|jgi:hypothetical protein|nr:hypothetical protein [Sphingomonadales bacterium]
MQAVLERYRAFAGTDADRDVEQPGYTIDIDFLAGLTESQKNVFKAAARRWSAIITGDVPSVTIDGRTIDDILITASGEAIDGEGGILGSAGPTNVRSRTFLPATATMRFDTADLAAMEQDGRLVDVIAHEMGHCLGIGTIWRDLGLLTGAGGADPVFSGAAAKGEYATLAGGHPAGVPVENSGGAGTRDGHWRESTFANEMMTGFIAASGNPISRVTVAALGDMGYTVSMTAAEPYQLPHAAAFLEAHISLHDWEIVRPGYAVLPD